MFSLTKSLRCKNYIVVKKNILGKYRKFKNPKISYIFIKALVLSIVCSKFKNEDKKTFKKEKSTEILKIIVFFKCI